MSSLLRGLGGWLMGQQEARPFPHPQASPSAPQSQCEGNRGVDGTASLVR